MKTIKKAKIEKLFLQKNIFQIYQAKILKTFQKKLKMKEKKI